MAAHIPLCQVSGKSRVNMVGRDAPKPDTARSCQLVMMPAYSHENGGTLEGVEVRCMLAQALAAVQAGQICLGIDWPVRLLVASFMKRHPHCVAPKNRKGVPFQIIWS